MPCHGIPRNPAKTVNLTNVTKFTESLHESHLSLSVREELPPDDMHSGDAQEHISLLPGELDLKCL